jgi:hypothetical protein
MTSAERAGRGATMAASPPPPSSSSSPPTSPTSPMIAASDTDALRARLYLGCMLPLCDVVLRRTPVLARAVRLGVRLRPRAARTQWRVTSTGTCIGTRLDGGRLHARAEAPAADVATLAFADPGEVRAFFTGAPPRAIAAQLVRAPLAFAPLLVSLARLRVLAQPATATTAAARALFVDAAVCLIALGLSQLAQAGHPGAAGVARGSPLRVYQWSVDGTDLAAYWRVERGRSRAGRGRYAGEPAFVHVRFAGVEAAFRALAGRGSQMERLKAGDVETTGSPEYARRVTELLWDLDRLLLVS